MYFSHQSKIYNRCHQCEIHNKIDRLQPIQERSNHLNTNSVKCNFFFLATACIYLYQYKGPTGIAIPFYFAKSCFTEASDNSPPRLVDFCIPFLEEQQNFVHFAHRRMGLNFFSLGGEHNCPTKEREPLGGPQNFQK